MDLDTIKHFLSEHDGNELQLIKQLKSAQNAVLPNNTIVQSTRARILPLNKSLQRKTCEALIFHNITNASLISVGNLCDDRYLILFAKEKFFVIK